MKYRWWCRYLCFAGLLTTGLLAFSFPTRMNPPSLFQARGGNYKRNQSPHTTTTIITTTTVKGDYSSILRTTSLHAQQRNDGGGGNNQRRNLLGLAFPVVIALASQAPLLAVIARPPSSDQREEMLTEWCKGDICTLLGGGSGYGSSSSASTSGEVYDDNVANAIPSLEEFEALSRKAAEEYER